MTRSDKRLVAFFAASSVFTALLGFDPVWPAANLILAMIVARTVKP